MDQYVHYVISPRHIDTLSTTHVMGITTLITNGVKLVSLTKTEAR